MSERCRCELMPRGECRNCRRPIVMFPDVGWLHDELPKYAHEPITCENAQPLHERRNSREDVTE